MLELEGARKVRVGMRHYLIRAKDYSWSCVYGDPAKHVRLHIRAYVGLM